ncbi:MAG: transposase [Gammaproteobacteria bacterium]
MTTEDFITELFCRVDDRFQALGLGRHRQAQLWPSEVVTLALLFALKGVGGRAFYRWISRDGRELFPRLPSRTGLFRRIATHWRWSDAFMAEMSLLGVADTYGIELLHPKREGRSRAQIGREAYRIIAGSWVKLGVLLNRLGLVVGWVWATDNMHDKHFAVLVEAAREQMVVLITAFTPQWVIRPTSNSASAGSGTNGCWWRRCWEC